MAAELLNAGMWAAELGFNAKEFKKAIEKAGIKPDEVKGPYNYYTRKTAKEISKKLKRMDISRESAEQSLKNEAYDKEDD